MTGIVLVSKTGYDLYFRSRKKHLTLFRNGKFLVNMKKGTL